MNRHRLTLALGILVAFCGTAKGDDDDCVLWLDSAGDAVLHRTDLGNDGAVHPQGVMPDILSISLCGWVAVDPVNDPYTGTTIEGESASLFRLDMTFAGLVNPPGRVFGGSPDPFVFGPSPLLGFLDIDVDDDEETGGELGSDAETRYLANIARFGRVPEGDIEERVARSRDDIDNDFYTEPQYERTGADFSLVLCGCSLPTIVSQDGNQDSLFDAGETWILQARFFERSRGYLDASAVFGGSAPGLYDPNINVRFSHDIQTDTTTVTVVWALDMAGAAQLAGQPEQPIDLNVANQASIVEALADIIQGANVGGFSGPGWDLVEEWEGEDAEDSLDPTEWEITALFGMPYLDQAEGFSVWTDTAGDETFGDFDGDTLVTPLEEDLIRQAVYAADGTSSDADGVKDGVWTLQNPGYNFSLFDVDGDMIVDYADIGSLRAPGDFNWDGIVNTQDFIAYLGAWVAGESTADVTLDETVNTLDFVAFLSAWVEG